MIIKRILFFVLILLTVIACKMNKDVTENTKAETSSPSANIENEIIVQLIQDTPIVSFTKVFEYIDIEVLKSLGGDMYLVTYNTKKINPDIILRTFNQNELVKICEFNKRVTLRGSGRE